jgi:hypothetical protein
MKSTLSLSRVFALVLALTPICTKPCSAQGWFQKATGVRTPEPIRQIAPNGIEFRPKQSYSYFNDPIVTQQPERLGKPKPGIPTGKIEFDNTVQKKKWPGSNTKQGPMPGQGFPNTFQTYPSKEAQIINSVGQLIQGIGQVAQQSQQQRQWGGWAPNGQPQYQPYGGYSQPQYQQPNWQPNRQPNWQPNRQPQMQHPRFYP